ncbi:STAS domain-containing protein [Streptomyces collinus]|uniref:STAS domain-containing protein n=1 Tax=Streptomyces collinus TaxID=42684 RepID=UPI0029431321|nr:STAS domain-containing protein [Streptomyces collinus]
MDDNPEPSAGDRLTISLTETGGVTVVAAHGEVDRDSAPVLLRALTARNSSACRTVLNLSGITFMDSSGINVLIVAHRSAESSGGWLRLAAPGPSLARLIQIVGLDEVIPCRPTVQDALRD